MSQNSAIEWTDATWNPVRGCTKISPGCKNCYAETFAERFRGVKGHPYEQGFDLRLVPEKLTDPLKWKKPKMIFVNSMSDLFQDGVPFDYIDRCFAVMALAHWHTFQVLTKRAERMREYMTTQGRKGMIAATVMDLSNQLAEKAGTHKARIKMDDFSAAFHGDGPFPNVWLGVSVESRAYLPRIAHLLQTPAAVRFLSLEPLLEDLGDLMPYLESDLDRYSRDDRFGIPKDAIAAKISWIICGSESGHARRPMKQEWVESIAIQCTDAGTKFFMKQMEIDGKISGEIGLFPERLRIREFPDAYNVESAKCTTT